MDVRLDGRVALITGGSKGIGLAIAVRMAASGASVAMLARRLDVLEEARQTVEATAKGRVHVISCDVSRGDEIARAHDEVLQAFGRVDILVNNAGNAQTGAFTSTTDEVWQADLDLKLFAAIRLTRLVWPGMVERRWGGSSTCSTSWPRRPRPALRPRRFLVPQAWRSPRCSPAKERRTTSW